MSYWGFRPYVSVAQRQMNATRAVAKLAKGGRVITPIKTDGRKISTTFWGKAWCDNLTAYSDYESRLPRGRRYVCNGSVVDLQIAAGKVTALVSGSELYEVELTIKPLDAKCWKSLRGKCAGQIGSLVELLQGKLSASVMTQVTHADGGLFPKPREISMDCSCPDGAGMCKHIAAVMYGIGTRLDHQPELLFMLRKVDHLELITEAGDAMIHQPAITRKKTLAAEDLSDVFGIELEAGPVPGKTRPRPAKAKAKKRTP